MTAAAGAYLLWLESAPMEKVYELLDVRPTAVTVVTFITLAISFGIAESFYKFHSFTLETGAFLVTWWVLRRIGLLIVKR
jgi:hypothetical protein